MEGWAVRTLSRGFEREPILHKLILRKRRLLAPPAIALAILQGTLPGICLPPSCYAQLLGAAGSRELGLAPLQLAQAFRARPLVLMRSLLATG